MKKLLVILLLLLCCTAVAGMGYSDPLYSTSSYNLTLTPVVKTEVVAEGETEGSTVYSQVIGFTITSYRLTTTTDP